MRTFKFFWQTHKWTGIVLAVVILMTSATGFLLLIKKNVAWIQPPTQESSRELTNTSEFLPLDVVLEAAFSQGHPDFGELADIDRIDFRPKQRVHKVRSKHNHSEIQIDALTGEVLSVDVRRSDLIERIHDGSFFGDWVHNWFMPLVSAALAFLVGSGLWLWIEPMVRRRKRRRRLRASVEESVAVEDDLA